MAAAPAPRGGSAMAGSVAAAGPVRLPPLREDLRLLPGPTDHDGAPTWTLHDPARNRFFRIGWLQFEIFSRWGLGQADTVVHSIGAETTIRAREADVTSLIQFAGRAGLLAPGGAAGSRRLVEEARRARLSTAMWLLKNYLFLRIRLFNPDRFLTWLAARTAFIYTRGFALTLGGLALFGLHMVGQQWNAYWHEFLHLFSLEGALLVGAALSGAKIVHEFGHGLTARHFGCRVPSMGVALLVLWPVLWTDTTDAWRLTDRRARLAIDAAGMGAEAILAVFATLAWTVLPDGPARTAAFMLSSSTWVITVLINVNPLMRFDGYYLLSDWLDVPNLQDRGFARARWWIRETLFGFGDPPPEAMPAQLARAVLLYGLATLTYRFFLFLGIAFLVYGIGFKALGLFLMGVELWWFIARPAISEFRTWGRRMQGGWLRGRVLATFGTMAVLFFIAIVPWRTAVHGPALLRSGHEAVLYTNQPGRLVSLPVNGASVAAGAVLFRLESPTLDNRREAVAAKVVALRTQIEGQAFDPDSAADIDVSWQELSQALAELRLLDAQRDALDVHAPFEGVVVDVASTLRPGQWLAQREALAMLIEPPDRAVEAYVAETDLARIHLGASATFYPSNGEASLALRVTALGVDTVRALEDRQLASVFGGPVAVRRDTAGQLIPAEAINKIMLEPSAGSAPIDRKMTGAVVIAGDTRSLLGDIVRRAIAVAMRESAL